MMVHRGLFALICGLVLLILSSCSHKLASVIDLKSERLKTYFDRARDLEIQVRYTRIDRDKSGRPHFTSYDYQVDNKFYFYPASTIKMPVAAMALQKVRQLALAKNIAIDKYTPMSFQASRPPQTAYGNDILSGQPPTIALFVDEIFSISDNNASNRLFEFVGPTYLNEQLYEKGAFTTSHIIHRVGVSGYTPEDNQHLNEISFLDAENNLLLRLGARQEKFTRKITLRDQAKGVGYLDANDSLVMMPFDFGQKNFISITDLEACIKRILFPEVFDKSQRFDLAEDDYTVLYRAMGSLPRDYTYLARDTHYYDTYVKFFVSDDKGYRMPDNIHVLNKVGWAYGYLTDCSYIFDTKSGAEFLLTATIMANGDGIFNDDKYDYEKTGLPFLAALGQEVLRIEQQRKRNHKANFAKYLTPK